MPVSSVRNALTCYSRGVAGTVETTAGHFQPTARASVDTLYDDCLLFTQKVKDARAWFTDRYRQSPAAHKQVSGLFLMHDTCFAIRARDRPCPRPRILARVVHNHGGFLLALVVQRTLRNRGWLSSSSSVLSLPRRRKVRWTIDRPYS